MAKVLIRNVAITIKSLRIARQLSQEELAERADLDRTYISGIERGVRNITLESLESVINALDIDISIFLTILNENLKQNSVK